MASRERQLSYREVLLLILINICCFFIAHIFLHLFICPLLCRSLSCPYALSEAHRSSYNSVDCTFFYTFSYIIVVRCIFLRSLFRWFSSFRARRFFLFLCLKKAPAAKENTEQTMKWRRKKQKPYILWQTYAYINIVSLYLFIAIFIAHSAIVIGLMFHGARSLCKHTRSLSIFPVYSQYPKRIHSHIVHNPLRVYDEGFLIVYGSYSYLLVVFESS